MYMNLKPNKHKRISFTTTTMASLGFIAPPLPKILGPPLNLAPPKFNFLLRSFLPPNYFGLKFLGPPSLKLGGGLLPWWLSYLITLTHFWPIFRFHNPWKYENAWCFQGIQNGNIDHKLVKLLKKIFIDRTKGNWHKESHAEVL